MNWLNHLFYKLLGLLLMVIMVDKSLNAQLFDNFSDGDIDNNPSWLGDTGEWIVEDEVLRTNGPAVTGTITSISTESIAAMDVQWEFYANPKCATSSGNYMDVYVIHDAMDLEGSGNGYFIRLGGSNDEVCLYKKTGTTEIKIIDGQDDVIAGSSNNPMRIKLTRDAAGTFNLWSDIGVTGSYSLEGLVADTDFTNSAYLGLLVTYSQANATKYFFDDFMTGPIVADNIAPELLGITVLSANELQLNFSEAIASSSLNNMLNFNVAGLGNPSTASYVPGSSSSILLTFSNDFTVDVLQNITIINITDNAGNQAPAINTSFTYSIASANDLIITEVHSDPSPVVGLPDAEFVEIYNRTNQAIELSGWSIATTGTDKILPAHLLNPGAYVILCAESSVAAYSSYGDAIGVVGFPALTNSGVAITIKTPQQQVSDVIEYELSWWRDTQKDDGGWTLERINLENLCVGAGNWIASIDPSGGTPGQPNSVLGLYPDNEGPQLINTSVLSAEEITLSYNESLDADIASAIANYTLSPSIGIASLTIAGHQVTIHLSAPIVLGQLYTLTIANVTDCVGNVGNTINTLIALPQEADQYDVIVTEMMIDESPSVGLPSYEYIEIENVSEKTFDLKDWILGDADSGNPLPSYLFFPHSRLIITSTQAAEQFAEYGSTIGMNFSALNNTAGTIKLTDDNGVVIHQISYTNLWYNNTQKDDGGWSLEMMDINNVCGGAENWAVSEDERGGTPGMINSVNGLYPDNTAPELANVFVENDQKIQLYFSETIDVVTASDLGNYLITPSLAIEQVSVENNIVTLTLSDAISTNEIYLLSVNNIVDCIGNSNSMESSFGLPQPGQAYDVIITEIMADPDPVVGLPPFQYIELHNVSNKFFELDNWSVQFGDGIAKPLPIQLLFPHERIIITSEQAVSLYEPYGKTIGMEFADLSNTGDVLRLYNRLGNLIHSVSFYDSWYGDEVKRQGGWSLEMIDIENPCAEAENWLASSNQLGGTPGQLNSVNGDVPDESLPTPVRVIYNSVGEITLLFSEPIHGDEAINVANYTINNGIGSPILATINSADSKKISLILPVVLTPGTMYEISISNGITDCAGNASQATTLSFGVPEPVAIGDIVINEILPNPVTDNVDFVEFYNRSNKIIDLKQLRICNGDIASPNIVDDVQLIAEESFLLFPHDIVAIATRRDLVLQQYSSESPDQVINSLGLPSYVDQEGVVILTDNSGMIIDHLQYTQDWHYELIDGFDGVSLERIDPYANTQDQNNWHSGSSTVGFATPGYKNSSFMDIQNIGESFTMLEGYFTPNLDGNLDFAVIQYAMPEPGYMARVRVYDERGRQIKSISNNALLSTNGFFQWDGTTDDNQRAPIGIYVVGIEYFDLAGKTKKKKLTVSLVSKL